VQWLHGYPSVLAVLAKWMLELKLEPRHSVKVITTGAENLLDRQAETIQKAFGVPVHQHYGQAEAVANFSECPNGRLHVDEDFSFTEFLTTGGRAGEHRIIGTNWSNPGFPLLRYDTGDIVTLEDETCSCGLNGRVVSSLDGRLEDYVILPNGSFIGRLDHIFKDLTEIREAQILQDKVGSLVFRVVKGECYEQHNVERRLMEEAWQRLGKDIPIRVDYVSSIPRTTAGKMRLVVSELPVGRMQDLVHTSSISR
jgi:phenylacetate-CoA ligase